MHSNFINEVLNYEVPHDPTFRVYQEDTGGSFKTGKSLFKYNDEHVSVDSKRNKATPDLCELLTESQPDKNVVTRQDKQAYKQILLESNAHRINYSLRATQSKQRP